MQEGGVEEEGEGRRGEGGGGAGGSAMTMDLRLQLMTAKREHLTTQGLPFRLLSMHQHKMKEGSKCRKSQDLTKQLQVCIFTIAQEHLLPSCIPAMQTVMLVQVRCRQLCKQHNSENCSTMPSGELL